MKDKTLKTVGITIFVVSIATAVLNGYIVLTGNTGQLPYFVINLLSAVAVLPAFKL